MRAEIEGFGTGWFQLSLRFRPNEIDALIAALRRLEDHDGHFHFFSDHKEASGVADIEVSLQGDDERDNMHATYAGAARKE